MFICRQCISPWKLTDVFPAVIIYLLNIITMPLCRLSGARLSGATRVHETEVTMEIRTL